MMKRIDFCGILGFVMLQVAGYDAHEPARPCDGCPVGKYLRCLEWAEQAGVMCWLLSRWSKLI